MPRLRSGGGSPTSMVLPTERTTWKVAIPNVMNEALSAIFWFIVTFSILVVLHEGGHFIAAKAFRVRVSEFMIGLPGPSIRYHGKDTDYGVTAIPLGGFVRIAGSEPGPDDPRLAEALAAVTRSGSATPESLGVDLGVDGDDAWRLLMTLEDWDAVRRPSRREETFASRFAPQLADDPRALLERARSETFKALPWWKRVIVLSAGVAVNFATAVLVFTIALSAYGVATPTLTVDALLKGGAAAAAGIHPGDRIVALNGHTLEDWQALLAATAARKPGDSVVLVVERDGARRTIHAVLRKGTGGRAFLGVQSKIENVRQSVARSLALSFTYIGLVFKAIGGFFNPRTFEFTVSQSSGVIGVAVEASRAAQRGPVDYAFLVALLSISLGAINILPIPPLDGGKVAMELVEAVRRRPIPRVVTITLSMIGTLAIVALMGYLMYADIVRYVIRGG